MGATELPFIDEHSVDVGAAPDAVWDAALDTFRDSLTGARASLGARLLGCDPATEQRWASATVGATIPGFRIATAERPTKLVIEGRHRFSRYAIVLRVDPLPNGARCRLESRAAFPGLHGRLYRLAVVGSGGHIVAVRRLLRGIRRRAEALP